MAETNTSTHYAYPRTDGQTELAWLAGYTLRWYARPTTATHPSINRAQRILALLRRYAERRHRYAKPPVTPE